MNRALTDIIQYPEKAVSDINRQGIVLSDGTMINFKECQKNYAARNNCAISKCVGDRNIDEGQFKFYCDKGTVVIEFKKETFLKELFGNSMPVRFHEMAKRIQYNGFTTFDIT